VKWISDAALDLVLDGIATSDEEAVCSQQPITYFNCAWGDLWLPSTVVVMGAIVHPPTDNGFIYECIVGGTTDATEPGWGAAQDVEFVDGTATWKTHENYVLASAPLTPANYLKSDGDIDGRKLHVGIISDVIVHTSGTVSHTALLDNVAQALLYVTTSETSLPSDNDVESGKVTILYELEIVVRDVS